MMRSPISSSRKVAVPVLIAALCAGSLSACGGSQDSQDAVELPAPATVIGQNPKSWGQIQLDKTAGERIGLKTTTVRANGSTLTVPYSALVYGDDGTPYVFVVSGPQRYTMTRTTVSAIRGTTAYLSRGPKANATVVTTGAAELYGVQTGVLEQT